MTQHTPLPWAFNPVGNFAGTYDAWVGRDGNTILHVQSNASQEQAEADRDFIDMAVHNHDAMLKALREITSAANALFKNPHGQGAEEGMELLFAANKARAILAKIDREEEGVTQ